MESAKICKSRWSVCGRAERGEDKRTFVARRWGIGETVRTGQKKEAGEEVEVREVGVAHA